MKIELPQFTMAYEDTGSGHPLLLIHGYPLGRRIWDPQLRGLLAAARLLVPDLRGHGDSGGTPGPYAMELHAQDCLSLLERCGVTTPVVACGLSMGGYVAMQIARLAPERVAGLVLVATRAGPDSPAARDARDADIALVRQHGVEAIADKMLPRLLSPAALADKPKVVELVRRTMIMTSVDGVVGDLEGMKVRPDMRGVLAAVGVPVIVIHGREDAVVPVAEAEAMAAAIPQAGRALIDGAGHLVNLEQPAAFNAALAAFHRRIWAH